MDIHTLRDNIAKSQEDFLGKVKNTPQNLDYLRDLESWGSLEIVKFGESYIEYRLM